MESNSARTQIPQTDSSGSNYFVRHWRGELSLQISFWVNNFLGSIAVKAVIHLLTLPPFLVSRSSILLSLSILIFLTAAIVLWQIVGTCRSALAHPGRGGSPFWAGAASVAAIFGLLQITTALSQNLAPLWLEQAKFAVAGNPAREATKQQVSDELKTNPAFAAMHEVDPAAFDEAAEKIHSSIRSGLSAQAVKDEAEKLLSSTLAKHGWKLSDAAATSYLDRTYRQLDLLYREYADACMATLKPGMDNLPADLAIRFPNEFGSEDAFRGELLRSTRNRTERRLTKAEIETLFTAVADGVDPTHHEALAKDKTTLAPSEYRPVCAGMLAMFEAALNLEPAQRADIARFFAANTPP